MFCPWASFAIREGFRFVTPDGMADIGRAREFYFDDKYWTVRYLVAETGGWLSSRLVLLAPYALHPANEGEQVLPVNLTKKQIENSPSMASDEPVSLQYEMQYYAYYGWPVYWDNAYTGGVTSHMVYDGGALMQEVAHDKKAWDPNLRSTGDVTGHHVQAQDGEIGHVKDFIIDDETWAIRYLVVDTKNWWVGKHVLIAPQWIDRVSWLESKVFASLSRETIKNSPEYTPESLNRAYETALHQHYSRPGYWSDEPVTKQKR